MSIISNNGSSLNSSLDQALYQQLKRLANKLMSKERENHTLSPTDLVHEAFVKLSGAELSFEGQKHHFRTLARQMRRVLSNYGRHRSASKNQGAFAAVHYTDSLGLVDSQPDFSHINAAIDELASMDERSAESIELVYFAALPQAQAAQYLGVSLATLERDIKFGRVFITEYIHSMGDS